MKSITQSQVCKVVSFICILKTIHFHSSGPSFSDMALVVISIHPHGRVARGNVPLSFESPKSLWNPNVSIPHPMKAIHERYFDWYFWGKLIVPLQITMLYKAHPEHPLRWEVSWGKDRKGTKGSPKTPPPKHQVANLSICFRCQHLSYWKKQDHSNSNFFLEGIRSLTNQRLVASCHQERSLVVKWKVDTVKVSGLTIHITKGGEK